MCMYVFCKHICIHIYVCMCMCVCSHAWHDCVWACMGRPWMYIRHFSKSLLRLQGYNYKVGIFGMAGSSSRISPWKGSHQSLCRALVTHSDVWLPGRELLDEWGFLLFFIRYFLHLHFQCYPKSPPDLHPHSPIHPLPLLGPGIHLYWGI